MKSKVWPGLARADFSGNFFGPARPGPENFRPDTSLAKRQHDKRQYVPFLESIEFMLISGGFALASGTAYSSSPISCQYCKDSTMCPFEYIPEKELNFNATDPKYPWKWLSEYCNQNHVGEIMQYFSLLVLLCPVFIIFIRSVIIGKA